MPRSVAYTRMEQRLHYEHAFARDIGDFGYALVDDYIRSRSGVKVKCRFKHEFYLVPAHFYRYWQVSLLKAEKDHQAMCPHCVIELKQDVIMDRLNICARQRGLQVKILHTPTFKKGTMCETCGHTVDHEMAVTRMMGYPRCSGCVANNDEDDEIWWVRSLDEVTAFVWVGREPQFIYDSSCDDIPVAEKFYDTYDGPLAKYLMSTARSKKLVPWEAALTTLSEKGYHVLNTDHQNPCFKEWDLYGDPSYTFDLNRRDPLTRALLGLEK